MRLTLHTFLTLDGVMQAPGGPGEDPDGHFEHGGWSFPYGDQDFGAAMVGWFANADAFLLGRKTYEIFSGHWPHVTDADDPIAGKLNALPKHIVSTTLHSVGWYNSSLLGGDVAAEVAKLKEQPGNELQVHGSGGLAQTLIEHDLVDEYRLLASRSTSALGRSSSPTARRQRRSDSPAPRRQPPESSSVRTCLRAPCSTGRTDGPHQLARELPVIRRRVGGGAETDVLSHLFALVPGQRPS